MAKEEIWPQRSIFRDDVLAFRKLKGLKRPEFAELIGTSDGHLNSVLYDKGCPVGLGLLQRASRAMGVSLSRWVDDPSAAVEDIDLSHLSPEGRLFAKLTVRKITDRELDDSDREAIYEAVQREMEYLRARKRKNQGQAG